MLRARAAASEGHARSLADSAAAVAPVLAVTGAGVGGVCHGAKAYGAGGGAGAMLASAMGSLKSAFGVLSASAASTHTAVAAAAAAAGGHEGGEGRGLLSPTFGSSSGGGGSGSGGGGAAGSSSAAATSLAPFPFVDLGAPAGQTVIIGLPSADRHDHPPASHGGAGGSRRGSRSGSMDAEDAQQASASGVASGGYDSLSSALATLRRNTLKEAVMHHRAAGQAREVCARLAAYRAQYSSTVGRHTQRASEVIRLTQAAVVNLRRANTQCERARREAEDAQERFQSARDSGAASEGEVLKRGRRHAEAQAAAVAAEEGVREAADAVVSSRKARDEALAGIARALQAVDEERATVTAAALQQATASAAGAAELSAEAAARNAAAARAVRPQDDGRLFVHQRRVAVMLDELIARHKAGAAAAAVAAGPAASGAGGGGAADPDHDPSHLLPTPQAAAVAQRHRRDFIAAEAELAPGMYRWVSSLLSGIGGETMRGLPLPAPACSEPHQQALHQHHRRAGSSAAAGVGAAGPEARADADAASSAGADGGPAGKPLLVVAAASDGLAPTHASPSAAAAAAAFEVSLLEEPAARQAFLRTLSARRGAGQHLSCASFLRLARALWWLLDVCASQDDARGAAAVLILSETYFRRAHGSQGPQGRQGEQGPKGCDSREGDQALAGTKTDEERGEADGVAEKVAVEAGAGEAEEGEADERSALIPEAEREYVQRYLRRHPLWRSDAFWQESLYRAVRDEVAKLIDPTVASNSRLSSIFAATETADAAAVAGAAEGGAAAGSPSPGSGSGSSSSGGSPRLAGAASARPGLGIGPGSPDARFAGVTGSISDPSVFSGNEGDAQYAYAQVLFGQLMALSVNMTSFDVPRAQVEATILRLAVGNGVPREMLTMLHEALTAGSA